MITRRALLQAGPVLAARAGAGLFAGAATLGSAAPASPSSTVTVEIRDYKFTPAHVTVPVGTTVRWVNAEKRTTHTVRLTVDGQLVESDRLFPGDTYERRFDKPGAYAYLCGPHPEMTGSIEVRP